MMVHCLFLIKKTANLLNRRVKLKGIIQIYFWILTIKKLNLCFIKTFSTPLRRLIKACKIYQGRKKEISLMNLTKSYALLRPLISFKKIFKKKPTHLCSNKIAPIKLSKAFSIKM